MNNFYIYNIINILFSLNTFYLYSVFFIGSTTILYVLLILGKLTRISNLTETNPFCSCSINLHTIVTCYIDIDIAFFQTFACNLQVAVSLLYFVILLIFCQPCIRELVSYRIRKVLAPINQDGKEAASNAKIIENFHVRLDR